MGDRVELPNGAWAELRDPQALPNRLRLRAQRAHAATQEGDVDSWAAFSDALCGVFVEGWSYALPLPGDAPASLGDIPGLAYDTLALACLPRYRASFLQADPTPEARKDPASPFGSSNGSVSPAPTPTPASSDPSRTTSAPLISSNSG
ncbi:MAG TPA: hypothetical protein VMW47_05415 [Verrucomicrobiae bacterium]|nr:hypothetical protein [Verrucomicrobiae bacterium]